MTSESGAAAAAAPMSPSSALAKSFVKYGVAALVVASILRFVSGHADWARAWCYVGFILASQTVVGLWLHRSKPELIAERAHIGPGTKTWDKVLAPLVGVVGPIAVWWTAAADVRHHWPPPVPPAWSAAAFAVCAAGTAFTFWGMWTNRFFANTVRIQSERGHAVVSTGPYAIVRHPGYAGAQAFTLASSIALGSWIALIPAVLTGILLSIRIVLEERTLRAGLDGYEAYTKRVRYRLIPGIW